MPFGRSASFVIRARASRSAAVLLLGLCSASFACAQQSRRHADNAAAKAAASRVPVLMLSDIHFDPFHDPAKAAQLREAPIEQWPTIFNAPPSPTQAADFDALQKTCQARGVDTWPALLSSSLAQAAAAEPEPLFVIVSGDLLVHSLDCRFQQLLPKSTPEDFSAFASKTVAFVTAQLRETFPNSPVYLALGNNDSGCTDYREDRNSPFLQQVAATFSAAARTSQNEQAILRDFSDQGDYNIALPAPMHDARLLVLQDIFEATHYSACNGKPAPEAETAQLAWLNAQLAAARAHHQHVWVMTHVPPGIDMYATISQHRDLCAGKAPATYLRSEKMADVLTAYADVVTLAIFAHSHADEMRFLHAAGATSGIPAKLVSSISPVNGNHPTFTVAQVAPRTAELLDYTVFLISDGIQASKEYSFSETYKFSSFSAGALQSLTASFLADAAGSSLPSQAYQRLYFPGDTGVHAAAMQLFWHSYTCSLREADPEAFRACTCAAAPPQ